MGAQTGRFCKTGTTWGRATAESRSAREDIFLNDGLALSRSELNLCGTGIRKWTCKATGRMEVNLGGTRIPERTSEAEAVVDPPNLPMVVECLPPLLFEIVGYAAGKPNEFAGLCMSSRVLTAQLEFVVDSLWSGLFKCRWPTFHECLRYQGGQDWKSLYRETLAGRCECTLEVFDREKKLGFAMAAMAARIQYESRMDAYVARYLSASEVLPEKIPVCEESRLRFCPESARERLRPGFPAAGSTARDGGRCSRTTELVKASASSPSYPYRVLEGFSDLRADQGVELQWKMQYGSPFGWWYGHLESLTHEPDGKTARATIAFQHFPSTSRWYRLEVTFGDSEMRACSFGGYTGGIRSVSEAEAERWMRFFPKEPVVF